MAKKRNVSLEKVKKYSDFLLYEATGGTMGKPFVRKDNLPDEMEFADKRQLLETLLKIAQLESKEKEDADDGEGEFDRIRKGINASVAVSDERDSEGTSGGNSESGDSEGGVPGII